MIKSVVVLALVITVVSAGAVFAGNGVAYGQSTTVYNVPSSPVYAPACGPACIPKYTSPLGGGPYIPYSGLSRAGRGPSEYETPIYPSGSRTDLYVCTGYIGTPVERGYIVPDCCPGY